MPAILIAASLLLTTDGGADETPPGRSALEVVRVHLKNGRSLDGVLKTRAKDGTSCRTSLCPVVVLCLPNGERRHLGATTIERIDEVSELPGPAAAGPVDPALATVQRCDADAAEEKATQVPADESAQIEQKRELTGRVEAGPERATREPDLKLAGTEEARRRHAPLVVPVLDSTASVTATLGVVLGSTALLIVSGLALPILALPLALAWLAGPSTADFINGNMAYALVRTARRVGIPLLAGAIGAGLIVAANPRFCAMAAHCGGSSPSAAAMLIAGAGLVLGAAVTFIVFTIIDIIDQHRAPDRFIERLGRE